MSQTSYLIEPDELEALHNNENIVIVDLCKAKQYAQAHIYAKLNNMRRHIFLALTSLTTSILLK
jgi:rhodanese-related sulfurtransferase